MMQTVFISKKSDANELGSNEGIEQSDDAVGASDLLFVNGE